MDSEDTDGNELRVPGTTSPNVVNTFCKGYDWSGKELYIFATSGGSGIGKTAEKLKPYVKGSRIIDAKRVSGIEELSDWR